MYSVVQGNYRRQVHFVGFFSRHIDLQTIFVAECTPNVNTILKSSDSIIH